MIEKMPPDICESDGFKAMQKEVESFLAGDETRISMYQHSLPEVVESNQQDLRGFVVMDPNPVQPALTSDTLSPIVIPQVDTSEPPAGDSNEPSPSQGTGTAHTLAASDVPQASKSASTDINQPPAADTREPAYNSDVSDMPQSSDSASQEANEPPAADSREPGPSQTQGTDTRPPASTTTRSNRTPEVIELFEPGVYVTALQLRSGAKIFKRVKFSKRKFAEQQAEDWWRGNKQRVLDKYMPPQSALPMIASNANDDPTSAPSSPHPGPPPSEEANS